MTYDVVVRARAEVDITQVADWYRERAPEQVDRLVDDLRAAPWIRSIDRAGNGPRETLTMRATHLETAQRELPGLIAATGAALHSLNPRGLADIFLDLTGGAR